ncbi:MAG: OPT family oligopeptide transporter [Planctomycetaceae bacterium]
MTGTSPAPTSPDDAALPDLERVPPGDRDRVWLERVYRGDDAPQATFRAILMGGLIGGVMSLSNLYVGLKTGWAIGVGITSCILSYAIWQTLLALRVVRTPMTILENNCMQSTAMSAGMSTGGTMVSAIAAHLILTGHHIPWPVLAAWTACLALLGIAVAVPAKRQLINREQLRFPSGVAAAETLRSLYASGGEALAKARGLFVALAIGAVIKWLVEGHAGLVATLGWPAWLGVVAIPATWAVPLVIGGGPAARFGLELPIDPMMMAAGALVGVRTAASMALGGVILYGLLGPWLESRGVFTEMAAMGALDGPAVSPGAIRKWGLWTGSALMVAAGLTALLLQWRSLLGALGSLRGSLAAAGDRRADPLARVEVPFSWFVIGTAVSGAGCVAIMRLVWNVPVGYGILSVGFAFVLSLVACRATGETDTNPIGAMGKVTQLFYGWALPQSIEPNLMTAGVTAGAVGAAADLLTDLKSGYLLGANPRRQTLAQAAGILFGTAVVVPAWYLLVPDPSVISGERATFTAPAAAVWASVAQVLARGLDSLHDSCRAGIAVGAAAGVVLTLLERAVPRRMAAWLPSPTGLGLAFVITFHDSIAFLVGAIVAAAWARLRPAAAERYTVPVASGIIAGESLTGVLIAFLQVFDVIAPS